MQPFNITAPEDIAKEYGGDKRRIAEAAQMGLVDPTSAVMAGMFIDRMRSAAQAEQAPQQTVAQATFAPQAPMQPQGPGGLGATPQAAQMGAQMPQQMPQQMPPQQPMPQMAEGGLLMLSIPDDDYAAGGLVSFADGGDQRRAQQRALIEVLQSPNTTTEQKRMAQIELERLAKEAPAVPPSSRVDPDVAGLAGISAPPQTGMTPTAQPSLDQGMETFADTQRPVNPYDPSGRIGFEGNRFVDTNALTEEEAKRISAGRAEEASGLGAIAPKPLSEAEQRRAARIQSQPGFFEQIGGRRVPGSAESQGLLEAQLRQRLDAGQEIPELTGIGGPDFNEGATAAPPPAMTIPAAPPPAMTIPAVPPAVPPTAPPPATTTPTAPQAAPPVMPEPVPQLAKQDVKSIEDYFKELSSLRPDEKGPYTQELEQMLASRGAALSGAKKEALNMALLQTGLGMLSQAGGQTALQALGTAALPATKVAADAIKEAKKEDRDLLKMGAAIEQAEGKRKDALLDAAVKKHGADKTAAATLEATRINAERETDFDKNINIRVEGLKNADLIKGNKLKPDSYYQALALQDYDAQEIKKAQAGATVTAAARVSEGEKKSEADINKELADRRAALEDSITIAREAGQRGMSKDQLIEEKLRIYEATLRGQTAAPSAPAGGTKPAPKVGDVSQGYRFKGGDPANPSNWEKI